MPTCPEVLSPQQVSDPLAITAQLCRSPAASLPVARLAKPPELLLPELEDELPLLLDEPEEELLELEEELLELEEVLLPELEDVLPLEPDEELLELEEDPLPPPPPPQAARESRLEARTRPRAYRSFICSSLFRVACRHG